jgi:antitoxin component of RelBE/YafQ-DinJ toxin-antitoxin module
LGYLEQFARNRRSREKSEVLTARLPKSLYSEFKTYCDELGLSISEAVCLLVEREMAGTIGAANEVATTKEYIKKDDVVEANTETNTKVVEKRKDVVKQNTRRINSDTKRFTTKQWKIDDRLPCPICGKWEIAKNYSRHAKTHEMTTQEIFTSEEYKDKINAMVEEKTRMDR